MGKMVADVCEPAPQSFTNHHSNLFQTVKRRRGNDKSIPGSVNSSEIAIMGISASMLNTLR